MNRILIAFDDSKGADQAIALVGSMPLPRGTQVRVLSAVEAVVPAVPRAWAVTGAVDPDPIATTEAHIRERNTAALERLADRDWDVEGLVVRDRPATAILEGAAAFEADLVVVGSRGQGPIRSLILGSVSSEVVDHSPSPVLVARRPAATGIVFATDGSASALAAEQLLATDPVFADLPITVVSVADVALPMAAGIAPTMYSQVLEAYAEERRLALDAHGQIANDTVQRLTDAGRSVVAEVRDGDAATEVLAVAAERRADLIVLGSRGHTGLKRLLLGSVARNVIMGTDASVLVVRAPTTEVASA